MKLPAVTAATAPASNTADGSGTAAFPYVCRVRAALMAVLPVHGYGGRLRVSAMVSAASRPPLSVPKKGTLESDSDKNTLKIVSNTRKLACQFSKNKRKSIFSL